MNAFMYRYERVGTGYNNQQLLIFANSQEEADIKSIKHMKLLEEEDNNGRKYKINKSYGEIDGLDIQETYFDYHKIEPVKQENETSAIKDMTNKYVNMIESFSADFELASEGYTKLHDLDEKISNSDEKLLADIDMLSELAYGLRSGIFKIVEIKRD